MGAAAAGLALGGLGLGIQGIAGARSKKAAQAQTAQLLRQQMIDSATQAQQIQTFQTEQEQAKRAAAERANQVIEQSRNKATASLTPFGSTGLNQLNTIATSPLGDTSTPFLGRKLLTGS